MSPLYLQWKLILFEEILVDVEENESILVVNVINIERMTRVSRSDRKEWACHSPSDLVGWRMFDRDSDWLWLAGALSYPCGPLFVTCPFFRFFFLILYFLMEFRNISGIPCQVDLWRKIKTVKKIKIVLMLRKKKKNCINVSSKNFAMAFPRLGKNSS